MSKCRQFVADGAGTEAAKGPAWKNVPSSGNGPSIKGQGKGEGKRVQVGEEETKKQKDTR
jgi:hypothetical protein